MEDIKAYIESGILELYVLGDVTPEEKLQVEAMALKHPAIKAELKEIEQSMELYAEQNAVEPSEKLRDRVLNSILTNLSDDETFSKTVPASDNIKTLPARKSFNFYKYAFAACLALLIASGIALINLYNKLQDSKTQLATLQVDREHFANRVNLMEGELNILRDTSYKFLKLNATPKAPAGSSVTIAWNKQKHKVMVDMASVKMPVNDQAHQYQLWAIVAGKPVDLGVFDADPDSTDMKPMKAIAAANADAFAVTLEPRGGSVNPTLDQMMVIGKF
ncbi:MAG TPA: anti-sigma factor [Mucilaginibacter sp.]|nr:anti-sigma factor [Mucilaginibacter sp.]